MEVLAENINFGDVCGGEKEARESVILRINCRAPDISENDLNLILWGFRQGYTAGLNSVTKAIAAGRIKVTLLDREGYPVGDFYPTDENSTKWA